MAKTKFTFTTAEGKVETRTSERTYTHVVVNRTNVAYLREDAVHPENSKRDASDYRFFLAMATGEVGAIPNVKGWQWPLKAEDKQRYGSYIAGYADEADYVAKKQQARLDAINERYGDADIGPEYVAQWSMSEANARKGVKASVLFASVRVAPVDPK